MELMRERVGGGIYPCKRKCGRPLPSVVIRCRRKSVMGLSRSLCSCSCVVILLCQVKNQYNPIEYIVSVDLKCNKSKCSFFFGIQSSNSNSNAMDSFLGVLLHPLRQTVSSFLSIFPAKIENE